MVENQGRFKKPKKEVEKWIFSDIDVKNNPNIVLNVSEINN